MTYNSTDAWAYGMLELIGTFIARSDLDSAGWERLKELIPRYCSGERATEAAITQFMAQLEHINEELFRHSGGPCR
jgi:hypothetical protein